MSKAAWSTSNLLLEQNDIHGNTLIISKANEVYMKVDAEPVIRQELSDYFTFTVPGAKFMPAYRNRMWDGKMRLYNAMTKELYLLIQSAEIEESTLIVKLRAVAAERQNDKIFLRADGAIPYERVVQVMGALNAGGFSNIGLVTDVGGPAFDGSEG